jgi:hypothetical protein
MVFFLAELSPGGNELAAVLCFAASIVRLSRRASPDRLAWVAFAAGRTVLALARSFGPYLVAASSAFPERRGRFGLASTSPCWRTSSVSDAPPR